MNRKGCAALLVLALMTGCAEADYTILPIGELAPEMWSGEMTAAVAHVEPGEEQSPYVLRCVDEDGEPVQGAVFQVCNDSACLVAYTDEEGVAVLTLAPYAWEVHLLKLPVGWRGSTESAAWAPIEGGEIVWRVEKVETTEK